MQELFERLKARKVLDSMESLEKYLEHFVQKDLITIH